MPGIIYGCPRNKAASRATFSGACLSATHQVEVWSALHWWGESFFLFILGNLFRIKSCDKSKSSSSSSNKSGLFLWRESIWLSDLFQLLLFIPAELTRMWRWITGLYNSKKYKKCETDRVCQHSVELKQFHSGHLRIKDSVNRTDMIQKYLLSLRWTFYHNTTGPSYITSWPFWHSHTLTQGTKRRCSKLF